MLKNCFVPIVLARYPLWSRGSRLAAVIAMVLWAGCCLGEHRGLFSDPDAVDVSLITVEPGNLVYDNFGHTALRVNDRAAGLDLAFNWGIFDFSDPISFSLRFYKGILIYKLGVYPYHNEVSRFNIEERTAYEDQLHLTRPQKEILLKRLIWHIKPENIDYNYDYFYDNCATRPRDYIDEAMGGALRKKFSLIPAGQSFREAMRRHYRSLPPIDLALDVLMNSRIDLKMSAWDKGFLPMGLRDMLLATTNQDTPLVPQSTTLVRFPSRWDAGLSGHLIYLLLMDALLIGILSPLLFKKPVSMRFLGAATGLYGIFFGLLGLVMPFNWLLSDHLDLHHNANMMFFWPFDLVYVYAGWRFLRFGPWPNPLARRYQDVHILFLLLGMILWASGVIKQDIGAISIYVLPPTLLLWILVRQYGLGQISGGGGAKNHGKKSN